MRGLVFFLLSLLTQVSSGTAHVTGFIGHNVTLPCMYDTQTHGILSFCWGRGELPWSKCSSTVLSSLDGAVDLRQSPRYQLLGRPMDGDVSLTILDVQWSDAGLYGCRIEIPGWFNDHRVSTLLEIEEVPEEQLVTEDWVSSTPDTQDFRFSSAETPPPSTNEEGSFPKIEKVVAPSFMEEFKAFLRVENIGRVAAIFFLTVIIILAFIFRRKLQPRKTLEDTDTSATENIYESVPWSA